MKDHVTRNTVHKMRFPPGGGGPGNVPPVRLPRKKRFDVAAMALPAFAVATGAMVGLSAPQLIDPSGLAGATRITLLTGSAMLVSYIVNRYAVTDGAEHAARGYLSAGITSVASILIVGGGLFASTFAGLTITRVNDLRLQQHGQALAVFVAAANGEASKTLQTKPVVDAAVADINLHVACEQSESCLSGRGHGGRGTVTRALEPIAKRAAEISAQLKDGDAARRDQLTRINGFIGDYQTTFSNSELDRPERRRRLARIDAQIKQGASLLKEAMPVALLRSYGEELEKGLIIAERPTATRNVNALLRRHGRAVSAALEGTGSKTIAAPAFAAEAGVTSTFAYMGHFLPIAALTAVIELVMPLTLWIYMLIAHLWGIYRDDPTGPGAEEPVTRFNGGGRAG